MMDGRIVLENKREECMVVDLVACADGRQLEMQNEMNG